MSGSWYRALGYALTGEDLVVPDVARPEATGLVTALADAGWSQPRIAAHASATAEAGEAWPHRVPSALREGCGAAQLAAVLGASRNLLGLATLETRPPSGRRRLDRDEERLMRDVPPHHGS